jgi:2'-5' RNA ligase
VRLFVALELPESHRAALAGVCERGRRGGVRWVAAENVHLTLKFLGEVDEPLVPEIEEALAAVAGGTSPFALSLEGGGCFPNARSPRVIWVGVSEGAEEASRLASAVEGALQPLGFAPEKRRFRPHLTIGRPKDPRTAADATAEKIEHLRGFSAPTAEAAALALIKSTLTSEGAVYEVVRRFELGGD